MRGHTKTDWLINGWLWLTIIVLAALVMIGVIVWQWNWLSCSVLTSETDCAIAPKSAMPSNSEVLRNAGFLIGGVLALLFALWRALVATRQADAAQEQAIAAGTQAEIAKQQAETARQQVEIAQQQAETAQQTAQEQVEAAQKSLLSERSHRGTEMLGSNVLSVRVAGAHELHRLAEEHLEQYHVQVMRCILRLRAKSSRRGRGAKRQRRIAPRRPSRNLRHRATQRRRPTT